MRYVFTLLLLIYLCTSGRAQNIIISASIALADDQCNPVINDPNTDCINVPDGEDELVYRPGLDGDIIITYRLTNNSGGTIVQGQVLDSDRGTIIPISAVNIGPGQTVVANRIFSAETAPRLVTPTVTATVENAAGMSQTVTGQYTLNVPAPSIDVIEFGIGRTKDPGVCNIEDNNPVCFTLDGTTSITLGARDSVSAYFQWQNTGDGTIDNISFDDNSAPNEGIFEADRPQDLGPNGISFGTAFFVAPDQLGTYNRTFRLTATDHAGNMNTATVNYTLIVTAPELNVTEFGIGRTKDPGVCNIEDNNPVCFTLDGTTSLTLGARDSVSAYFQWQNTGDGTIDNISFDDSNVSPNEGIVEGDRPQDLGPNSVSFGTAFFVAPDLPGTYNRTFTLTATDPGGNVTTASVNYTLIVTITELDVIEFGIGRTKDPGVCNIEDNNPVCFSLDGTTSLTLGARDSVSAYFSWQNVGDGIIDRITFDDSNVSPNEGIVEGDRPQDLGPNSVSFGTAFFVAPDLPGTYNRTLTLTATDFGGNVTTATVNYTLIVTALDLVVTEFGIGRTKDPGVCNIEDNNPVCFSLNGTTSITVGARDSVSAYFQWQNIGDGIIDRITFDDSNVSPNEGIVEGDRPQDLGPNSISFGTAFFVAPDLPGTYNRTLTLTATDFGGNVTTATVNYTLIVTAPDLIVTEFGIGRTKDPGVCNIEDLNPVCFSLDGTTSITVGARDSVSAYFQWQNIGDGIIDRITFDDSNVSPNEGIVEGDRPQDLGPNSISFGTAFFVAPDLPGTYTRTFTLTATDLAGNMTTASVSYSITVDCSIADFAPPTAVCREDRTVVLMGGETQSITPGQIDDGSFDDCDDLASRGIDVNLLSCEDEGQNIITLTVEDLAGNQAVCTSMITVVVESGVYEGVSNSCESTTTAVAGGQAWRDIEGPDGNLVAQVIVGNNTNVENVRAEVYKTGSDVDSHNGFPFLSKRISLTMLDGNSNPTQPSTEPIYVRLYYTEAELSALEAAEPGSGPGTFAVIKNDGTDCGTGYTGANATGMNTTFNTVGCDDENGFFEFFTGAFSTFYLFASDATLPVELMNFTAGALPKQRVQLDWTTLSETGNSHFEIERSKDGQEFLFLGAVAGAGESQEAREYAFTDNDAPAGTVYYRLRQVDLDGSETLSEVRRVMIDGASPLGVYPNPATTELHLTNFSGGEISIFDAYGRRLLTQVLSETQSLQITDLPAGAYWLRTDRETVRWIKR